MFKREKLIYTFFLSILPLTLVFGQEQASLRDRAAAYFNRYEFAHAANIYAELIDRTNNPRFDDLLGAAESYYHMRDFVTAERYFALVVAHKDHGAPQVLSYADVLKANGKYAEAKEQFARYLAKNGPNAQVQVKLDGCDSALYWMANPTSHAIHNEKAINGSGSEFSVAILSNKAYFVGESQSSDKQEKNQYGWTGRPYLKIYSSSISESNTLGDPVLVDGDFNQHRFHVGPIASPDGGKTLYITRTYAESDLPKVNHQGRNYKTHRLELFQYMLENGIWKGVAFPYNDPTQYSVGHATFSTDGQIMYFASDRPGGFGGTDIWFSRLQADGTWGAPQNAGAEVNSAGDELFPVMGHDGKLYFATDGKPGMGGLDIFSTSGNANNWSKPQNLGYPVNSPADDFAYLPVKSNQSNQSNQSNGHVERGFLASNRQGGLGNDDIYSFTKALPPQPIQILLMGRVQDKSSGQQMAGAQVSLSSGGTQLQQLLSKDGTFQFTLEADRQYLVEGKLAQYESDRATLSTDGIRRSDTLNVVLTLERTLAVGKTFVLQNLYYDFDKHNIRPDAAKILDELIVTLKENPTLKIELSSHTDSRGNDDYNLALSQRRAQAAVDYLIANGISRDRLRAKGYGERKLVNACANGVECTEEQHQANRRTEVTVLDL